METTDFYSSATGTLEVKGGRDENAPKGVSLSIDDLSYIKQGSRAYEGNNDFTPTQAQLDAMNSGITSADVRQITTNKNDILAAYGGIVAKNILNYDLSTIKSLNTSGTWSNNAYTVGSITCTINNDNTITITGDNTGGSIIYFVICDLPTDTYTTDNLRRCTMSSDSISQARMTITNLQNIEIADTTNGTPLSNFTTSGSISRVRVVINNEFNTTVTIKPMICDTDKFAISPTYQPYVYDSITLSNFIRQLKQ